MLDVPLNALGLAQARVVGDELAPALMLRRSISSVCTHARDGKTTNRDRV